MSTSYRDIARAAQGQLGELCHACPVCDGRACGASIPGPGAKGSGTVAARNYRAWQDVAVNMDVLHDPFEADTSFDFFGRTLRAPVMVGPVGDVERHYGTKYSMARYNETVVAAARRAGTLAWTGDGVDGGIYAYACQCIKGEGGAGVAVCKPWSSDVVERKVRAAMGAGVTALAMDVDAAGLPFLKGCVPPAGPKSVDALREIVSACDAPFIVKGVMTPVAAEKCREAGAAGIVVSNHGGRVLDGCPATAEVLPEIAAAAGDMMVFVDGGVRSGLDVFRALALGADAVLVCRPFVVSVYGMGEDGLVSYFDSLVDELRDVMEMCGAATLADIDGGMVRLPR